MVGRCPARSAGAEEGRDEGVLLRDGSGNEGEGRAVPVREGRSTRKEVARQHWLSVYTVLMIYNSSAFEFLCSSQSVLVSPDFFLMVLVVTFYTKIQLILMIFIF